MNTKRRAYALTEMLVIIVVLVVLMALTVRPFRTMIAEIPRSARVCQTLNATQRVLSQLKTDIEQSNRINSLKNGVLELEFRGKTVTYTFTDGKIVRKPGITDSDREYVWQLPSLKINAKLWRDKETPYAFELSTWNQQNVLGREQIRFKQTTVFFRKGGQR